MEYKKQTGQVVKASDRNEKGVYPTSIERIRKIEYPLLESNYFSMFPCGFGSPRLP